MTSVETFSFRFASSYRLPALLFGITPRTARVTISGGRFEIRFGPWLLRSELANIADTEVTGPYQFLKTAGPAHLPLADRGITFATNSDRGLCIRFRTSIPAMDPLGVLRHPAATVTIDNIERLAARLLP
jgi:hypothetical protein